jgi:hypothetical protein
MTRTALPITSAERFWLSGPVGIYLTQAAIWPKCPKTFMISMAVPQSRTARPCGDLRREDECERLALASTARPALGTSCFPVSIWGSTVGAQRRQGRQISN